MNKNQYAAYARCAQQAGPTSVSVLVEGNIVEMDVEPRPLTCEERETMDDVREIMRDPPRPRTIREEIIDYITSRGGCHCNTCVEVEVQRRENPITRRNSYERMPEACPVVSRILNQRLPGLDFDRLRDNLEGEIFEQVTRKFRYALTEAVDELHKSQDDNEILRRENGRIEKLLEQLVEDLRGMREQMERMKINGKA